MKPLVAEQIDVLVHPNWEKEQHFRRRKRVWERTIEEVAGDQNRVLVIVLSKGRKGYFTDTTTGGLKAILGREKTPIEQQQAVNLVQLAVRKIGRRRLVVLNHGFKREKLVKIFESRGIALSPKAKMNAFGVWKEECVRKLGRRARYALGIPLNRYSIESRKSVGFPKSRRERFGNPP